MRRWSVSVNRFTVADADATGPCAVQTAVVTPGRVAAAAGAAAVAAASSASVSALLPVPSLIQTIVTPLQGQKSGYGTRTTLPMLPRSAIRRCASPARSKGKTSATTGSSSPASSSSTRGPVIRLTSPSRSHQLSMLSPKTPLFSFISARLFHQGAVAKGMRARLPISLGMLLPALAQEPIVLAEVGGAGGVHDHVDALAVRDPPDLGLEVLRPVVDRVGNP